MQSPWQKYFQDAELKKQIVLDIRRVYPESGFFRSAELQEMMLRILFIYAREHEHILYKQVRTAAPRLAPACHKPSAYPIHTFPDGQGMHELLAPILYVLHREAISDEKQADDESSATERCSPHAEHIVVFPVPKLKTRSICSDTAGEVVTLVNASRYVEHDAYALFTQLMEHTHTWFLSGTRGPSVCEAQVKPNLLRS